MTRIAIEIPFFDSVTKQFQVKENGQPVDISGQTLIFYLEKNDGGDWTPIEKNIGDEGWIDNAG